MVMQLAVQTMTSYAESLALARWAEKTGLSAFAVADHYLSLSADHRSYDQLTLLGGIARETSRIALASLVSPITFRHPSTLLKVAVTLDELSAGRFSLGVGAGWMEEEHQRFGIDFPTEKERFERLEEALAYLQAAVSGGGFEGRYYRLADFLPQPKAAGLRIIVGGSGPRRTPNLAGSYADEYNAFPDPRHPLALRVSRAKTAAGGRPLLISTAFPGVAGRTDDEYRKRLADLSTLRGTTPDRLEQRLDRLGIPCGTPAQVTEGVAQLAEVGVERIYLQVAGVPLETVKAIVEVFLG